ncbi:hypothetical protein [Niveispirillum irakense]|nr:hypothetical protein [Niveispirillum irakense]
MIDAICIGLAIQRLKKSQAALGSLAGVAASARSSGIPGRTFMVEPVN